jgi:hypothetical protein
MYPLARTVGVRAGNDATLEPDGSGPREAQRIFGPGPLCENSGDRELALGGVFGSKVGGEKPRPSSAHAAPLFLASALLAKR